MDSPFITRVVIENFKSIRACDVRLSPLTFLVGPNGAGKSNFCAALAFIAEVLETTSLDAPFRRGNGDFQTFTHSPRGLSQMVASSSRPMLGIRVDFSLDDDRHGHYAFRLRSNAVQYVEVVDEEAVFRSPSAEGGKIAFRVHEGRVRTTIRNAPEEMPLDMLLLFLLSSSTEFRAVYEALKQIRFYDFHLEKMRGEQSISEAVVLNGDGSNLANVLTSLERSHQHVKQRLEEYLAASVGVYRVKVDPLIAQSAPSYHRAMLVFFQGEANGNGVPEIAFPAFSMSDGTLNMLGMLVAAFQTTQEPKRNIRLVGFEEPEKTLHPGATHVLRDALLEASAQRQIIVTTHSPDLLDDKDLPPDSILAVTYENGETHIGPLDEATRSSVRDRLYTTGEFLRMTRLHPDPTVSAPPSVKLFDLEV